MMITYFIYGFGIVMLLLGLSGLLPALYWDQAFLGSIAMNGLTILLFILTGICALACGYISRYASRLFFQVISIFYGLGAIISLYYGPQPLFGLVANNIQNAGIYIVISLISIYFGFIYPYVEVSDRDKEITGRDEKNP